MLLAEQERKTKCFFLKTSKQTADREGQDQKTSSAQREFGKKPCKFYSAVYPIYYWM